MAPDFSVSAGCPVTVFCHSRSVSDIDDHDQTSGRIKPDDGGAHLQCIYGASPAPTCSLGAISVTNNTGTSVLTVTTSGAQAALAPAMENGSGKLFAIGLLIPVMLLGGAGWKTPNRRKLVSFCLTCLLLGACLMEAACSSAGSKNPMTVTSSGTPGGTYTITVSGNSNGMQHTTSVSLTVQ